MKKSLQAEQILIFAWLLRSSRLYRYYLPINKSVQNAIKLKMTLRPNKFVLLRHESNLTSFALIF